jgi:integrase
MEEEKAKRKKKKAGKRANNEGTLYQRSDGRWEAKILVGYNGEGKPKRKSLFGKSQKEVEAKLTEFKQQLRSGMYIEPSKLIFGEWLIKWLDVYVKPNVKAETYSDYVSLATKHILPLLGAITLQDLHGITIQEFYNLKAKSGRMDGKAGGLSTRRLHMMHQLINGCLRKALKLRMLSFNPADEVELPSIQYKEFETFTEEEVRIYLETLREDRLYALFLLELTTGLRRGELLGIPRDQFDPTKAKIDIIQTLKRKKLEGEEKSELIFSTPKTKKSKRVIPLLPEVVKEIKRFQAMQRQEKMFFGPRYQDSGLLFTSEVGTPIEPRNLNRKHASIIKKAGLKHVRVHDLRHTVASLLLDDGEAVTNVSELLGHAKMSTTLDIYGHSTPEGKVRAVARLGNIILKSVR